MGIGLIPSYTIAKRIEISIDPSVSIGYQWANKDYVSHGHFSESTEECVECGIVTFYSTVFRIGYWF
jgi:hypothetical protein